MRGRRSPNAKLPRWHDEGARLWQLPSGPDGRGAKSATNIRTAAEPPRAAARAKSQITKPGTDRVGPPPGGGIAYVNGQLRAIAN